MKLIKQNCQIKQNSDWMKKKKLKIILTHKWIKENYAVKNWANNDKYEEMKENMKNVSEKLEEKPENMRLNRVNSREIT